MVIGVTGGIATGKSAVVEQFRLLGASVVSADALAREVVAAGSETLRALVKRFGADILTAEGTLDRAALGKLVFSDPQAREALNRITHPAIARLAQQRIQALRNQGATLILYEAPLLFEAGAEKRVDAVLVVTVSETIQLQRLMARDGFSEDEARARIAAQMPLSEKVRRADFVLDNSGSLEAVSEQVKCLYPRLLALSRERAQARQERDD